MTQTKRRQQLETFFRAHTRVDFKKGETIVRPQDDPSGVFFLDSGHVKAYNMTKYAEENLLLLRGAGSIFPLIWAFTGEHRQVSYESMDKTVLWRVSRREYLDYLEKNPDVLPVVLDMTIEAYRLNSERVMTLSYRTARERIISFLLNHSKRFGVQNSNGELVLHAPLRQSDIASSVNATRETTSREINSLKKKGLIGIEDHKIVLKDVGQLEDILG
jgi:CRP/FNR family cyclic AMP-dependent transcriptional regulator